VDWNATKLWILNTVLYYFLGYLDCGASAIFGLVLNPDTEGLVGIWMSCTAFIQEPWRWRMLCHLDSPGSLGSSF